MAQSVELVGSVEKTLFKSKENGYIVFLLKVNARETVTVTGHLPDIHDGAQVTLQGSWSFHPKFGKQFNATTCKAALPQTVLGIKRYLSSGLIKGIGPKFAERLVERFGVQTLEVIDTMPERLYDVPGVGKKRVATIIEAWQDQREISKVMVFLQEREVSTAFAAKIYKKYGDASIEVISQNPYRLIDDIWGVGFKSADQLALKLGFASDSLQRLQAGLVYAISLTIQNGHLYMPAEKALAEAAQHLGLEDSEGEGKLRNSLRALYQADRIKVITYEEKHYVTLPQYYYSEKGIATKILSFAQKKSKKDSLDLDAIYQDIRAPKEGDIALNEEQQSGVMSAFIHKVTVITGGPGTGKTTLVKKLLDMVDSQRLKARLAAPTGRAAKRMFEGTGRPTETIHRLLEFSPATMGFTRNEQNALQLDILIVDEASMIDVFLMHSLLRALPDHAHLVLLGDVDQLPSVGAGNVLNDLIDSGVVAVTKLIKIFRQAQDSMIIVNAHKVNKGEFPNERGDKATSRRDFVYVKQDEPEQMFGLLRKVVSGVLQQRNLSPDDMVVLTPMNRGIAGTQRLNQELQLLLNPPREGKESITRFGIEYREGDRVMQIRNNYDKFVFNGDIGRIVAVNKEDGELSVRFGNKEHCYQAMEMNELVLAYAISIHKSQGSEFNAVIIPIFMQHFMLLQRNLIYTAITRAKKLCILAGQPRAIAMGVKKGQSLERITFLKQFLTSDLEAR